MHNDFNTRLGQKEPAQAALHSYFNIGDISQIEVQNLPSRCYDSLQGSIQTFLRLEE